MQNEIRHTWLFDQSAGEIWKFLTEKELIAQWLMPNDFESVIGHEFQFSTRAIPGLQLDGIFYCKVLEIIPNKKLSYSWKGGPGNQIITLDTLVVWTLQPKGGRTELELVHSGFKEENIDIFSGMFKGWLDNVNKITGLLNTKENANNNA